MIRQDMRSDPVRRMVVMGESNAYGMSASCAANEWVQVLGQLIREFQDGPLRVLNHAIPSNVISPDAPGYKAEDFYRTAPSAIERFETDMLAYQPDLAVYAYGLNDSRCGHAADSFLQSYRHILTETRKHLPESLLLVVGPYWNPQYDAEHWASKESQIKFGAFSRPGDDLVLAYNDALPALAAEVGAVFVDVYKILQGSPWLVTKDDCHFNDVGQRVIGMTAFSALAGHCSFLARMSRRMEAELGSTIRNTGGTNALPHVINTWRQLDSWS